MRLGLLTSGGDGAGLNAVIRAVVKRAVFGHDWEVFSIRQATHGLLARPVDAELLTPDSVAGFRHLGGIFLGTTDRGNPFAYPSEDRQTIDRSEAMIAGYHDLGLNALIGIGGNGTLAILDRLAKQGGLNLVGIPKTIDNDVCLPERAIGFSTAVVVATEAVDRLHVTAASHNRVLGSVYDVYAVDLVAKGQFGRMVAWQNRRVIDVAIEDAFAEYRAVDPDDMLVHTARGLGISFGDEPRRV